MTNRHLQEQQSDRSRKTSSLPLTTITAVFLVFCAALLIATAPAAADHNSNDGYNWANNTYDDLPPQMKENFSRSDIVSLFSSDDEPDVGSDKFEKEAANADLPVETLKVLDAKYDRPPKLVGIWNRYSLNRYRQYHLEKGGTRNSIFPYDTQEEERAEYIAPKDGTPYEATLSTNRRVWGDGHLSIMSVQPSTVVHESWSRNPPNRQTSGDVKRLYVKKTGSVYVAADVRVEDIPETDKQDVECEYRGGECQAQTKYVYGHSQTVWEDVRLQVSTGTGQYTTLSTAGRTTHSKGAYELNYSLPEDTVGPRHFRVIGTINVTLDRTKFTWEKTGTKEVTCNPKKSDCPEDGTKTVDEYGWVKQNVVEVDSFSKQVDDTVNIYRPRGFDQEESRPTVRIGHLPNGETQVRVNLKDENSQGRATRSQYWSRMSLWTTDPTRTDLTVSAAEGQARKSNIALKRKVSSESQLKIWARGDFDTLSETFTVKVNGVQVFSGKTRHEDTIAGKRHLIGTVDLPAKIHTKESVNISVETSGQVDAEGGLNPRFWFKIQHKPVPVSNDTLYESNAAEQGTTEDETSQTHTRYKTVQTGKRPTSQVESQWMFFSARDQRWDELWRGKPSLVLDHNDKTSSPVRPVYTHAFPSAVGERSQGVSDLKWLHDRQYNSEISEYVPYRKTSPRLRKSKRCADKPRHSDGWCNFLFEVANESPEGVDKQTYVQKTGAVFKTNAEADRVIVYGMVRGQNVSAEVVSERSVGRVNIKTEVNEVASYDDGRKVTVTFTLTNQNGEPVSTKARSIPGEYLRVMNGTASKMEDGEYTYSATRVETNSEGEAKTTVYLPEDGNGKVYVRYISPQWWEIPEETRPYTQVSSNPDGEKVNAQQLAGDMYLVGTILIIPVILFYLVLQKFGIDLGIEAYKEILGKFIDERLVLVFILGLLALYFFG